LCAKGAVSDSQTTLQGKEGRLITVMEDWEQLLTNATLFIKPAKHCHNLLELYRAMKKPSGKADLGIYGYSVVMSG